MLFEPIQCRNIDEFAFGPVISGAWKQHEIWDGTYLFEDLLDYYEIESVKYENQLRYNEAMEAQQRALNASNMN